MTTKAIPFPASELYRKSPQRTFRGQNLLQIAMPLGGIGAGCIALNGQGGLRDFSIRNAPGTSAMADGHNPADSAFATLYLPALGIARLVEAPCPSSASTTRGSKARG